MVTLSVPARQRAASAIVSTIAGNGKLRLFQGSTLLVQFDSVSFGAPDSSGYIGASGIPSSMAVATGYVDRWELLDGSNDLVASGTAGQRHRIVTENRSQSWVIVNGMLNGIYTPRINVTLHNKNNFSHNVYLRLNSIGSEYDSGFNVTKIYFHEDLSSSEYSPLLWTHIHVGELGMDNAYVIEDQVVTVNYIRFTVL